MEDKKKVNRKRPHQMKFFVDEEELNKINKNIEKSKLNKSDFLRAAALEKDILVIEDFREFYIEIKRQGSNINQLAKAVNQGKLSEINFLQMEEEYKKINEFLSKLVRKL